MKKSKRNKAQKRQQVLQRRRQQTSIRRPVSQIPPESANHVAMTTTGEILQLIRLHYEVLDVEHLRALSIGWNDEVESNAVDVHLHGLRRKLGADVIRNVRGVGWMIGARP